MSNKLVDRLAAIALMSPAEVRQEWERLFKRPLPINFSPDLMRRMIAHQMQERTYGGPYRASQRQLARLLKGSEAVGPQDRSLHVGTRLAREWRGTTHHVLVTSVGFEYREQTYRSLSSIARSITGVAWSGPRFFGLLPGQRGARGG